MTIPAASHYSSRTTAGSATELAESWRRCGREDPLHAVITWNDHADREALLADTEASNGIRRSALHGRLIMLKDNIDTAGLRTTAGAGFWSDRVPDEDAEVVRVLRRSGLVIGAKTNMSEVALGASNANAAFGDCRNPWDPDRISGGSSGGSAVAVAANYCQLSLGTDTGGSIRIPASLTGVLGLRPSFGRISTLGVIPLSPAQDVVGPMGREARLVATLTDILTTGNWSDGRPFQSATALIGRPLSGTVVGVVREFGSTEVVQMVQSAVEEFAEVLAQLGAVVRDLSIPDWSDAAPIWSAIAQREGAVFFSERLDVSPEDFAPDVLSRLQQGSRVSAGEFESALKEREAFRARMRSRFVSVDAILSPTTPTTAPRRDSPAEQQASVGALVHPWALHDGPTLSIPAGFGPPGLPIGVSLTASYGNEALLFQLAQAYQQTTLQHVTTPPRERWLHS